MNFANPIPWFVICTLCLLIGGLVAARSEFFRARLAESTAARFETLDGLRGFLALGVFGGHAMNMYNQHATGTWSAGAPSFYGTAAETGVALFFAITGFLFWLR